MDSNGGDNSGQQDQDGPSSLSAEEEYLAPKRSHVCPVPKPKGLIGEVLGFTQEGSSEKPPRPRIETGTKSRKGDEP